jgi:nitrite reductase/ring-hydroxylating ferredoxin subunit
MAKLINVAGAKDLAPGQSACFEVEGQSIAVFNVDGTLYAVDDACPHSGGPLSQGNCSGTTVSCPWHGADFDLRTGAPLGPPADEGVHSYKVIIDGDDVKVEV